MAPKTSLVLLFCLLCSAGAHAQTSGLEKRKRCIVQGDQIITVEANYSKETNSYTITRDGKEVPMAEAYPTDKTYAAGATWFTKKESIVFGGETYTQDGNIRVLNAADIKYLNRYQGVPVFVQDPAEKLPDMIFLAVRPGCEFQPYEREDDGAR